MRRPVEQTPQRHSESTAPDPARGRQSGRCHSDVVGREHARDGREHMCEEGPHAPTRASFLRVQACAACQSSGCSLQVPCDSRMARRTVTVPSRVEHASAREQQAHARLSDAGSRETSAADGWGPTGGWSKAYLGTAQFFHAEVGGQTFEAQSRACNHKLRLRKTSTKFTQGWSPELANIAHSWPNSTPTSPNSPNIWRIRARLCGAVQRPRSSPRTVPAARCGQANSPRPPGTLFGQPFSEHPARNLSPSLLSEPCAKYLETQGANVIDIRCVSS